MLKTKHVVPVIELLGIASLTAAGFAVGGTIGATVMASIGIAAFPEHADDDVSLIHNADAAMYVAKKNQKLFATYAPKEADALALTG